MTSTTVRRKGKTRLSPQLHSPHQQARNKRDLLSNHAFTAGATDEPLGTSVEPDAPLSSQEDVNKLQHKSVCRKTDARTSVLTLCVEEPSFQENKTACTSASTCTPRPNHSNNRCIRRELRLVIRESCELQTPYSPISGPLGLMSCQTQKEITEAELTLHPSSFFFLLTQFFLQVLQHAFK